MIRWLDVDMGMRVVPGIMEEKPQVWMKLGENMPPLGNRICSRNL